MADSPEEYEARWNAIEAATGSLGLGIVITVTDAEGRPRPVYVNDAHLALLGYEREEYLALPPYGAIAPEELPRLLAMRGAGAQASSLRLETVAKRKDGTRVPVEIGFGRTTWLGEPAVVTFVRDVSAGRAAAERLVNLETIYNATIDGLLFVDRDLNLVSANRRFAEIFGMTLDEVLRLPKDEVRRRARSCYRNPQRFDDAMRAYDPAEPLRTVDGEIELVSPESRIVHEHSEPIFDAGGEYVGRVWTYRDVTRERTLARELARYAETLESEVQRRSAKLAEAQKMAALGQLVAGVAHEINNPLAFVKSNTAALRETWRDLESNPDVCALFDGRVERAEAAARWLAESGNLRFLAKDAPRLIETNLRGLARIGDIVRSLKVFAAPQAGAHVPTDLRALVVDATTIFAAQFGERVTVERNLEDVGLVPVNAGRIGQVLMNLLVNAAQAIDGKGIVRVSLARERDRVLVRVADDGGGIAPENLDKIFDPFFTTKPPGNTGLGLSISYGIVKEHGGEIVVDSTPGRGTTFSVYLPLEGNG